MSFKKAVERSQMLFEIDRKLSGEDCKQIVQTIETDLPVTPGLRTVVLEMGEKHTIDHAGLRCLTQAGIEFRKRNLSIAFLRPPHDLTRLVNELGLDGVFRSLRSRQEVEHEAAAPAAGSRSIDVNLVNPFVEGVARILEVQCQTPVQAQKLLLKGEFAEGPGKTRQIDIAGVIGITSVHFTGTIAICFGEATFLALMSKMLGETFTKIDKDLEDGAGELLNMIYGHAKVILNAKGYALAKAIPTVVTGKGLALKNLVATRTLVLPFESEAGGFHLEIGTEPNSAG